MHLQAKPLNPSQDMNIFNRFKGKRIETKSLKQAQELAQDFALQLPPNCTVGLSGELGVGKTSFAAGMVRSWGITEVVKSPSYNIMNIYEGTRQIIHMDAYRLESPEALDALMIEDFLQEPWVVLVEWPENVNYELFGPIYRLELFIDNGAHFVRFHSSLE